MLHRPGTLLYQHHRHSIIRLLLFYVYGWYVMSMMSTQNKTKKHSELCHLAILPETLYNKRISFSDLPTLNNFFLAAAKTINRKA